MEFPEQRVSLIDGFLEKFIEFIESLTEFKYYKNPSKHKMGSGVIELASGILVSESEEAVLVLDNEFESFLMQNLSNFVSSMTEQLDNKLFGFAERPLHEYITTWIFIFFYPDIEETEKNRLKTLLFAGHYKYITEDKSEFDKYIAKRKETLRRQDIRYLESNASPEDYFKRTWEISKAIRERYGREKYQSTLDENREFKTIMSHQNMRLHSNPLAILETFGDFGKTARHRLLLCFYCRQVLEYLQDTLPKEVAELVKQYEIAIDGLYNEVKQHL